MNKKTTFIKNSFLVLSSLITVNSFSQALLGEYDFAGGGACPHNSAYLAVSLQPSNASFSLYSTVGTTCASTNNQFGNTDWETGSTVNLNQYNQFSITPANGYVLNLTSIEFQNQSLSTTGCVYHIRSSMDNYASDLCSGNTIDSWETASCNLVGLDNISSQITFRIYVTGIDATTTRWRQDNVIVYGNITQSSNPQTWYADIDNDSYGDAANSEVAVSPTLPNAKLVAGDCNDNDNTMYPGATEICDGKDNDCDASTDEGLTFVNYYADLDGDSFGSVSASAVNACAQPANTALTNTDCNDNNSAVHPQAIDTPDNGVDEDCSGADASTASLNEKSNEFKIFPNPVNDELTILTSQNVDLVKVYALDGTLVLAKSLKDTKLNVSMLTQGSYKLVLFNQSVEVSSMLFVKK